jgi:hypothetical protein
MRFRPDGGVVLPAGERVTIEVELHAGTAGRLAAALPWYRDPSGYAGVRWLVPDPGVETPLWAAMAGVDPEAGLMAVERFPAAALAFAGG